MQHLADLDGDVLIREITVMNLELLIQPMPEGARLLKAVLVDVETTGLTVTDEVIEIALLPVMFDADTGAIYAIGDIYTGMQQPEFPLSEVITRITGIVDADLEGRQINWAEVNEYLAEADVVIAYNAGFDRKFIDRALNLQGLPCKSRLWACAMDFAGWDAVIPNLPAKKLQVVCNWSGFWFRAHRAEGDIIATLVLLATHGKLADIYQQALRPSWQVFAWKAAKAVKDQLKHNGYWWDGEKAFVWYKKEALWSLDAVEAEMEWLSHNVYMRDARGLAEARPVDPLLRFGLDS